MAWQKQNGTLSVYALNTRSESSCNVFWITLSCNLAERHPLTCSHFSVFFFGSALSITCESSKTHVRVSNSGSCLCLEGPSPYIHVALYFASSSLCPNFTFSGKPFLTTLLKFVTLLPWPRLPHSCFLRSTHLLIPCSSFFVIVIARTRLF